MFKRKKWFIRIICGHCGYVLRDWDTGLAGLLAPIGTIISTKEECSGCKKQAQWWINAEPYKHLNTIAKREKVRYT